MGRLNEEARMTIKVLDERGAAGAEIARLLGVSEGAVRYHVRRMKVGAADGRGAQPQKAAAFAEAIEHWRQSTSDAGLNLAALHSWLVREHGYDGSLRSVQRFWKRTYPTPRIRARRRVETPPGAQVQVDWAHFPGMVIGNETVDMLALHMVLSHSRKEAIVWARSKDMLSWISCHIGCFQRLGGVAATARIDNEKTAVSKGAGAWGTVNPTYRAFANTLKFHVDACAPRQPQAKGKVERRVRDQRHGIDPYARSFATIEELQAWTDEQIAARDHDRRCPATGTTVAEAWEAEKRLLTPLPDPLPVPFDVAVSRKVGIDGLVSFEGRQYSVPFHLIGKTVEVRGIAGAVQVLKSCEIVAQHPRGTDARLLIDQAHYDGESDDRVIAPPPLGRMGRKIQELIDAPVARRAIETYHLLAEVAR
jgi:transposase